MSNFLRIKEVSERLGVPVGIIKGWQKRGILNGYRQKSGSSPWFFKEEDIAIFGYAVGKDKVEHTSWLCSVHKVPLRRIPQFPDWLVHDGCHEQFIVIDGHLCILEGCCKCKDIETGEYQEAKDEKLSEDREKDISYVGPVTETHVS